MSRIDNINRRLLETEVIDFIGFKVQMKRSQTMANKYCLSSEYGGEYATGSYGTITGRALELIFRADEYNKKYQ